MRMTLFHIISTEERREEVSIFQTKNTYLHLLSHITIWMTKWRESIVNKVVQEEAQKKVQK
jgi:hypothetical protein